MTDEKTYKVLVAEDNDDLRGAIVYLLKQQGYEVQEAADGKQALLLASSEHPDVAVLDLHMPIMGGWEVCRRIKSDKDLSAIRVVMMTADLVEPEDAEYGMSLGADEYVVKPFISDVLLYNVARLLKGPVGTSAA